MCWQRWDSLEDRKPFIWDLSTRRSDLGREKINTAETLSTTVKTRGEDCGKNGKRVQGRGRGMAKHTLL